MNNQPNPSVERLINDIIRREGGFVDHPLDRGGPTNYGITLPTLSTYRHRACTVDDIRSITSPTAFSIYYILYYLRPNIGALPVALQAIITDMAVNHGPKTAIILFQEVLKAHGKHIGAVDGLCGPLTCRAAECAYNDLGSELIDTLVRRRVSYYEQIVKHDYTQRVFLSGWINRAESFLQA